MDAATIQQGIQEGLSSPKLKKYSPEKIEVAFYGGTFTALPQVVQLEYLKAAAPFLVDKRITGIRLSTRPDYLNEKQISLLRDNGVGTVEIGAQSFDDRILRLSGRGHTGEDVQKAAFRVKSSGLRLGLQLLPGLPGEDSESRRMTLAKTIELKPDDARIYPLVVIKATPLALLYQKGKYTPLTLDEAVRISSVFFHAMTRTGINVIRSGLQDGLDLADGVLAGPYHPSFGELVKSEIYYQIINYALPGDLSLSLRSNSTYTVYVSPSDLSQAIGQKKSNIRKLENAYPGAKFAIKPDHELKPGFFRTGRGVASIYDFEIGKS